MTIGGWLSSSTKELVEAEIDSARLDAEIILAHTLGKSRTYLHAHFADELDARLEEIATARLDLRRDRTPVAYIIGHKEFYGRMFMVSPHVLVPRPESEEMIDLLREMLGETTTFKHMPKRKLVDIGTGSGCLGVTAKLLYPELDVTLLDTSQAALDQAKKNAHAHNADVTLVKSNLLSNYPYSPDIVLANLPYVDETWKSNSPELHHEPAEALFAARNGLALIEECLQALSHRMSPDGIAIFEADPRQWPHIDSLVADLGFRKSTSSVFATCFIKN